MKETKGTLNVKVRISMWQALKIRISGLFKNIEEYNQFGDVIIITYIKNKKGIK